jgi:hypothetical protein
MRVIRAALVLSAVAVAVAAPAAQASAVLPQPRFSEPGHLEGLAASGARVAFVVADGVSGCKIRVANLAGATKPATAAAALPCRQDRDGSDASVSELRLGRTSLAATVLYSPSPHGDTYSLWTGQQAGPLRLFGSDWGWTDSSAPPGFGCAQAVAAGGGVIAAAQVPNRLAVEQGLADKPACVQGTTTQITLNGAAGEHVFVAGSWTLLATDGKRLALARLDESGLPTGELSFVGLDGKPRQTPQVDPASVKTAIGGWLAPEGLVLRTKAGISGPGWTIGGVGDATVAEGRLVYVKGKMIRVRRIRDGVDRALISLPGTGALVAAGSSGLAIATENAKGTSVYRLPWRIIDLTLPGR